MINIEPYLDIKNYYKNSDLIRPFPILFGCLIVMGVINFLGFVFPPFSILVLPFTVSTITVSVLFSGKYKLIYKAVIIPILIIANDLSLRTFAGGTHDAEGNGFILLFTYIALFLVPFYIIVYGVVRKNILGTFFSLSFVSVTMYFYLLHFSAFGLTFSRPVSQDVESAQKDKVFVTEQLFYNKPIVHGTDTFYLKNSWIEKRLNYVDYGFYDKYYQARYNWLILNIEGDFDKNGYDGDVSYKIDTLNYNAYSKLKKRIVLQVDSTLEFIPIIFIEKDEVIGKIRIRNSRDD